MPISPENKKLYPKNWPAIRSKVLARAASCEFCDLKNYARGWRDSTGKFWHGVNPDDSKNIRIVITIAHLDHDPTNNDMENLRALCQRCHNRHDSAHRSANRKKNRSKA